MRSLMLASTCLAFLVGCGETEVNWQNYSPEVKQRIEKLIASKDCKQLQKEFNAAELNSDAQKERTGEGNALLMIYIDENMHAVGCHAQTTFQPESARKRASPG